MRRTIGLVLMLALALVALASPAAAGNNFVAPLSGDEEVPARDTAARGVATFKLRLCYRPQLQLRFNPWLWNFYLLWVKP